MTFDPNKPVQTRDGLKARIICTDRGSPGSPVFNIVALVGNTEQPYVFKANGQYLSKDDESALDLVNVPEETHEFWNLYERWHGGVETSSLPLSCHESLESARKITKSLGVVELVKEDGEIVRTLFHPREA